MDRFNRMNAMFPHADPSIIQSVLDGMPQGCDEDAVVAVLMEMMPDSAQATSPPSAPRHLDEERRRHEEEARLREIEALAKQQHEERLRREHEAREAERVRELNALLQRQKEEQRRRHEEELGREEAVRQGAIEEDLQRRKDAERARAFAEADASSNSNHHSAGAQPQWKEEQTDEATQQQHQPTNYSERNDADHHHNSSWWSWLGGGSKKDKKDKKEKKERKHPQREEATPEGAQEVLPHLASGYGSTSPSARQVDVSSTSATPSAATTTPQTRSTTTTPPPPPHHPAPRGLECDFSARTQAEIDFERILNGFQTDKKAVGATLVEDTMTAPLHIPHTNVPPASPAPTISSGAAVPSSSVRSSEVVGVGGGDAIRSDFDKLMATFMSNNS